MKQINFGIEIETVGRSRGRVAEAICSVVGGRVHHEAYPACYDPWHVTDARGRTWQVMADSSLSAAKPWQAEVVSPILTYGDLPELQEVVRAVRRAGARCDASTGIHVHLDGARFEARTVCNMVKIMHKQEPLLEHALGISPERRRRWCKGIDPDFMARMERIRPKTLDDLNRAWYGHFTPTPAHYHATRYVGLNLHSLWHRGTIEFRLFNGTLHAGKVKAYIQLCLALGAKALRAKSASAKRRAFDPATARYDFRVFLLGLGMVGDEFKTARLHLLANCAGSSAWKHGRPAERAAA